MTITPARYCSSFSLTYFVSLSRTNENAQFSFKVFDEAGLGSLLRFNRSRYLDGVKVKPQTYFNQQIGLTIQIVNQVLLSMALSLMHFVG